MAKQQKKSSKGVAKGAGPAADRSIHVGGSMNGSAAVTGDGNQVSVRHERVALPPPQSVDVATELAALRGVLAKLEGLECKQDRQSRQERSYLELCLGGVESAARPAARQPSGSTLPSTRMITSQPTP